MIALAPAAVSDCLVRPEVRAYVEDVRARAYGRWVAREMNDGEGVVVAFRLDEQASC